MTNESAFHGNLPPEDVLPADASAAESPANLTAEDRQWAMLADLSALVAGAVGGMTFLGPLIVWLIKKEQSPFVDFHGKEALNFQLNLLIYMVVLVGVSLLTCGFGMFVTIPILIALGIYAMIMPIIAGLKANEGAYYRYPATFRMIA